MLNIENKYKAFHISFYPHTSLTAGLNIFEKTFHSRRKRGCIYTSTHANEHVYRLETRSPNYNTIKVHPDKEKKEEKKKHLLKSISQLVHGPLSEQAAFKVGY